MGDIIPVAIAGSNLIRLRPSIMNSEVMQLFTVHPPSPTAPKHRKITADKPRISDILAHITTMVEEIASDQCRVGMDEISCDDR